MRQVDLNADLGEEVTDDATLLTLVTSANVACGYHAGTPVTMRGVCAEAARLGVAVGAQVSYADRENFGRVARDVPRDLLTEQVADQVGTLTAIAVEEGVAVSYVKAHGALYHRVREDAEQAAAVLAGSGHLPVLGQHGVLLDLATGAGRATYREGFADRAYRGDALVPRDEPGALIEDVEAIAAQAVDLVPQGRLDLRARRQPERRRGRASRPTGAHRRRDRAGGPVVIAEAVREALADGRPVVALESTIFTHGLPRPRNVEVALKAEDDLRAAGVEPATIGVLRGVPTVGLTADQIRELGADDDVIKVSLRDLPIAAAQRRSGGTTVAGTAFLAARAGIAVFATGGLGGVHRGAAETFDESADLPVLAQTPILMVSAGVKSILDVGASLERLETLSITLVGYRTTRFPGFYLADSGFAIDYSVDDPQQAADLVRARDALGVPGAILVANPVPAEHQLDPAEHDRVLGEALAAMDAEGIGGHDATPYLLDRVQRATEGRSLDVNVAVYENNVALAGAIARALADDLAG